MKSIKILFLVVSLVIIFSCKKEDSKDTTSPTIKLLGKNPLPIDKGTVYSDPGATAYDETDGDISTNINVTSNVNTSIIGTYIVKYNVSDKSGNAAIEVSRTVNVLIFK